MEISKEEENRWPSDCAAVGGPRPNCEVVGQMTGLRCITLARCIRITIVVLTALHWAKGLSPAFSHWHPNLREVTPVRIVPLLSWMGKLKLRERVYLGVGVKCPAVSFRAFPTA